MATRVSRVIAALERKGLRGEFDAIEQHGGEVVLWAAGGYPVSSVREALDLAQARRDAHDAELARDQEREYASLENVFTSIPVRQKS